MPKAYAPMAIMTTTAIPRIIGISFDPLELLTEGGVELTGC